MFFLFSASNHWSYNLQFILPKIYLMLQSDSFYFDFGLLWIEDGLFFRVELQVFYFSHLL